MKDKLDIDKELVRIHIARNNEYIRLEKEGKTREEILPLLQHYQDEIDALLCPKGRKPEKKNEIGDIVGIYKLIGNNSNTGGKFDCKKSDTAINGKLTYHRIFIRKVGYRVLTSIDNGEEFWEVNIEPEEIDDYINHNAKYFEAYEQE